MLKKVTPQQAKSAWSVTNKLAHAIDMLNHDIGTMVVCMPIKPCDAVDQFVKLIREDVGTQCMRAVGFGPDVKNKLKGVFGDPAPLLTTVESDIDGANEIVPDNNLGLTDHKGNLINLTLPPADEVVIASLSTQADSKKLIAPIPHRDEDVLTVNFYAAGKGITYQVNGAMVSFKSPCITAHRGTAHYFGKAGAVKHVGQTNEGVKAANILWDMRHRASTMIMLG